MMARRVGRRTPGDSLRTAMHELSVAQSIVQIALRNAGGRPVTRVELRVGHLRQVVSSSLYFAFEAVTAGTAAEGAELVVEQVPVAGECRACGAEGLLGDLPLACAACGSRAVLITAGEELSVEAIEVEDGRCTV